MRRGRRTVRRAARRSAGAARRGTGRTRGSGEGRGGGTRATRGGDKTGNNTDHNTDPNVCFVCGESPRVDNGDMCNDEYLSLLYRTGGRVCIYTETVPSHIYSPASLRPGDAKHQQLHAPQLLFPVLKPGQLGHLGF